MYFLYILSIFCTAIILKKIWQFKNLSKDKLLERISNSNNGELESNTIIRELEGWLPALGVSSRIAPLIGLLGTVVGMINTFKTIELKGGSVNILFLSRGIWQALLTTAGGLIIAIIAVIFYHFFLRKIDEISFLIERENQNEKILQGRH